MGVNINAHAGLCRCSLGEAPKKQVCRDHWADRLNTLIAVGGPVLRLTVSPVIKAIA